MVYRVSDQYSDTSLNDRTVNFCKLFLLKCPGYALLQLFLIHALQKVVASCFRELGPRKTTAVFLLLWRPSSRKHGAIPLSEVHESKQLYLENHATYTIVVAGTGDPPF